jgi:hypothetical protein
MGGMPLLTVETVGDADELTYTVAELSLVARACCDWNCLLMSFGDVCHEFLGDPLGKSVVLDESQCGKS